MSIFDNYLSAEEKALIANQYIKQYASEAYQHSVLISIAEETGNDEMKASSEAAIVALGIAIEQWEASK